MERTIKPQELKERIAAHDDVTLLDVRRKADYDADKETIPGAVWRDPEKVEEWSKELPRDKDVIIYCVRGGSVSNKVLDELLARKIQASFIEGGIAAWKAVSGMIKNK